MTDFIIGCTHFGHANIIKLANRPFDSVEEMDKAMIFNWNSVVGENDTVFHLGDFAWGDNPAGYLAHLNGNVEFLNGNHDPENWGHKYLTIKRDRRKIVLFHYPIEEWDGWFRGSVHFHAHTHKPKFQTAERRGNVCAEALNYVPIRLNTAIRRLTE